MVELSAAQIEVSKRSLRWAFDAARGFDGSEAALDAIINPLSTFEDISGAMVEDGYDAGAQAERALARQVFNGEAPPALTVSEVLDIAVKFYARLQEGSNDALWAALEKAGARVEKTDYVFVRTNMGTTLKKPEKDLPELYSVSTKPRLAQLIERLANEGLTVNGENRKIFMDDLSVIPGTVDDETMREHPYNIIQIPCLNMEIAVCDQVGEITFVKRGTVDPVFWSHLNKDELEAREDVWSIKHRTDDQWWGEIEEALSGNAVQRDRKVALSNWKPNLDMDLVRATLLAHYVATAGEWLSDGKEDEHGKKGSYVLEHGPYAGLLTCGNLDQLLRKELRGVPEKTSIPALNEELSARYRLDYVNALTQEDLTPEMVKESLLLHYVAHAGQWLSATMAEPGGARGSYVIKEGPCRGTTVSALNALLTNGGRGLDGDSSIAAMNTEISRKYGLDYVNHMDQQDLDIDNVRSALLTYYMVTGERVPTTQNRAVALRIYNGDSSHKDVKTTTLRDYLKAGKRGLPEDSSIAIEYDVIAREIGVEGENKRVRKKPLNDALDSVRADLLAECDGDEAVLAERAAGLTIQEYATRLKAKVSTSTELTDSAPRL